LFEEHEARGLEAADLAAEFRADATTRAGDQYDPITKRLRNGVGLELNRLPAKQVFDAHVTDAREVDLTSDQLEHTGDDLGGQADVAAVLLNPSDLTAGSVRDGDDHLLHRELALEHLELRQRSPHRDAVHHHPELVAVVVDEP